MIVFGLGPAGTGKTYLAMAMAITAFKNNEVSRIILTRPAIEAGEKLGFLPGDLQSGILRFIQNNIGIIQGSSSHICKRCHFNQSFFHIFGKTFRPHDLIRQNPVWMLLPGY